ncbi:MAG: phosphatidylinositol mannoside acyltransferase, partial [Bifidobacteriaceae bacterium]|nr:phosphatidylinositol mannoside acyltransferase [Bifidobacteriaceae bacterium]
MNWTLVAWRWAPRLPQTLTGAIFDIIAVGTWARHGKGVRQLERNLARVCPDASERTLRRLSRRAMVAYMRYYHEIFHVSHLTPAQVVARIRPIGRERLEAAMAEGRNPVLALAHMGNWDMAGAWATREVGAVTTVAERLESSEVFDEFVAMRAAIGLTIVPSDPGKVFGPLLAAATSDKHGFVPVLADRDLSRRGI